MYCLDSRRVLAPKQDGGFRLGLEGASQSGDDGAKGEVSTVVMMDGEGFTRGLCYKQTADPFP